MQAFEDGSAFDVKGTEKKPVEKATDVFSDNAIPVTVEEIKDAEN